MTRTPYTNDDDPRIENYEEVIEALEAFETMKSDGEMFPAEVTNPRITGDAPKYLRVKARRDGFTFNVIEKAREMGLEVTDVWQLTGDHEEEVVCFKLEPRGKP